MKQELAISLYARNILSVGEARALADLCHAWFHVPLDERESPRRDTEAELAEDLHYAE